MTTVLAKIIRGISVFYSSFFVFLKTAYKVGTVEERSIQKYHNKGTPRGNNISALFFPSPSCHRVFPQPRSEKSQKNGQRERKMPHFRATRHRSRKNLSTSLDCPYRRRRVLSKKKISFASSMVVVVSWSLSVASKIHYIWSGATWVKRFLKQARQHSTHDTTRYRCCCCTSFYYTPTFSNIELAR